MLTRYLALKRTTFVAYRDGHHLLLLLWRSAGSGNTYQGFLLSQLLATHKPHLERETFESYRVVKHIETHALPHSYREVVGFQPK